MNKKPMKSLNKGAAKLAGKGFGKSKKPAAKPMPKRGKGDVSAYV